MVPTMDSGQSRAASLMHAARRSHFVSRIEKYEAKLRQARAVTREQRLAMATSTGERQPLCKEEDNSYLSEKVVEQEQPVMEQKGIKQQEVIKKQDELSLLEQKTMIEKKEIGPGTQELQRTMSAVMKDLLKHTEALNITSHMPEKNVCTEDPKHLASQVRLHMEFLKPFANPEVNIAAVAASLKVRIKAADMPAPMQEHAFRHARECSTTLEKLHCKHIAYSLKKEFDKVYGPAWHCIVGTSFGSYVTHSLGGFAYFSLDKISILLFKTTVEPLEH